MPALTPTAKIAPTTHALDPLSQPEPVPDPAAKDFRGGLALYVRLSVRRRVHALNRRIRAIRTHAVCRSKR